MARTARSWIVDLCLVAAYVGAAVAANIGVTFFGARALPFTAVLLIPFDLTSRDVLHDRWHGRLLLPGMAALILSGSIASFLACPQSGRVATASFISFLISGIIDFTVYSCMMKRERIVRMNASNAASSLSDSIAFPLLAFGSISPWIAASQFIGKWVGGLVWSVVLTRRR